MTNNVWPVADVNLLKIPSNLPDKKVILLSDILPTAWHANEVGRRHPRFFFLKMHTVLIHQICASTQACRAT